MLYPSALRSLSLKLAFGATEVIVWPFYYCLNQVALPFCPVTPEWKNPTSIYFRRLFLAPVYLTAGLILFIPALLALIIRTVLFQFEHPFQVSDSRYLRPWLDPVLNVLDTDYQSLHRVRQNGNENKLEFSIATSNVCLCPDFISHMNNLPKAAQRAKWIGERIVIDQLYYRSLTRFQQHLDFLFDSRRQTQENGLLDSMDTEVLTHFPHLDFICFQEAFDRNVTKRLMTELQKVFPWVIHNVGAIGPRVNYCGLNSGLAFASKHEIQEVKFRHFTSSAGTCSFTSKGLLMVKVLIKKTDESHQRVGYVFVTHLQAFHGKTKIVSKQLSQIQQWTKEFRTTVHQPGDVVLFDMLCGDFNIDNMSPGDAEAQKHDIFRDYTDVCRQRRGQDYDWALGTEFRVSKVHDDAVASPNGLRDVLLNPTLRQQYILNADIESSMMNSIYKSNDKFDNDGNLIVSPVGGKRRVDYILHRTDCNMKVESYNAVTRLATLTDHIPVSMTFSCSE